MPQSRNRPGHQYQKPSDIPAKQRVKGTTVWMVLAGVFGLMIAYFAVGTNYAGLAIGLIAGAALGYLIGKQMQADAKKKD
jgi:uncharacterized membrane protein YfcA